jgi:hypothetical protein
MNEIKIFKYIPNSDVCVYVVNSKIKFYVFFGNSTSTKSTFYELPGQEGPASTVINIKTQFLTGNYKQLKQGTVLEAFIRLLGSSTGWLYRFAPFMDSEFFRTSE